MDRGESPTTIARILGVRRHSVYRWRAMARDEPDGLAATPHPGRPPRLSDDQLQRLDELLLRGAKAHGWDSDLWTAARVTALITRHFGVRYHVEHVRKLLRGKLGRSSQKPQEKARGRDEAAITH